MEIEYEATFPEVDRAAMRKALSASGFVCMQPETKMIRKAFHFPDENPRKWARVRHEGDKVTMSVKETADIDAIHNTTEIELTINDFDKGAAFLEACGLHEAAYQETLREKWKHPKEPIEAMIDTWPGLPTFLELEGAGEPIVKKFAALLGLDYRQAVFGSVALLYQRYLNIPHEAICKRRELTFEKPPTKLPEKDDD